VRRHRPRRLVAKPASWEGRGLHGHASAPAPSRQPLSARRHVRDHGRADEAGAAPGAAEPAAPPPPAAPSSAPQPEAEPPAQADDAAAADAAKPLAPAAPEQPAAKYRHQYFQTATARRRRACAHSKVLCGCLWTDRCIIRQGYRLCEPGTPGRSLRTVGACLAAGTASRDCPMRASTRATCAPAIPCSCAGRRLTGAAGRPLTALAARARR